MTPPFLKRYLIAVEHYKWAGLACFVVITGISGAIALQPDPPPTYLAEGVLSYNRQPVYFSETGSQIQEKGKELNRDILLDESIMKYVGEQINLDHRVVRSRSNARVPTQDEIPLIKVYYTDVDRQRAETAIKAMLDAMVEQSRLINTERVRAIMKTINERLPEVTQELRVAEQELERYEREEGAAILAAQSGSLAGAIVANETQQRQLRLTIQGLEAQIRSLSERLGLTPDEAYAASALSADPIIARLRASLFDVESQISVLSRDLRSEHPQMAELLKLKEAYDQQLSDRATEVIGGNGITAPLINGTQIRQGSSLDPARQNLANTLVALQTERDRQQQLLVAMIQSEQELRQDYATLPNKQLERARLEQQVQLQQNFYNKMQTLLADTQKAEAETISSLSIAAPPKVADLAESRMPGIFVILIGAAIGAGVGGILIYLLSMLEGRFYTHEEIRSALQERELPLLGILPVIVDPAIHPQQMPLILAANSPYLEVYERLRSNLRRVNPKLKVILMTSTGSDEGKTLSAYNLAIASARAGKRTLLIEADLRSPSAARSLRVTLDPDMTLEPLRYYGQLNECIRFAPVVENLYIIPSPGPQRNAAVVLESSEMIRLLEDVRGRFDFVVIDTPPLSRCNDPLALEPYTDGLLIVTRPRYTEIGLLTEFIEPLIDSEEIKLLGTIINGADIAIDVTEETWSDLGIESSLVSTEELRVEEADSPSNSAEIPTGIRF